MSPKVGVAHKRKAEIIEATFFCIALKGYSNITMQDIADSAGVSKGVIHYYFRNKEELFLSVHEKLIGDLDNHIARKIEQASTPPDKVRSIIRAAFEKIRGNKKFQIVLLDFWAHSTRNPRLKAASSHQYARYRHTISKIIADGIEGGQFKKCDPNLVASALISLIEGHMIQWVFGEKDFAIARAQKMTEQIISAYILA